MTCRKQQHLRQASNNCTATGFALIRCRSISMKNHVWMRIGVSPGDEAVWRAIDGATVLQEGSHFPGSRSNERSEKREERRYH